MYSALFRNAVVVVVVVVSPAPSHGPLRVAAATQTKIILCSSQYSTQDSQ